MVSDVNGTVTSTSTFQDWKLVLLSPWGTVGQALALLAAILVLALAVWSYREQVRSSVKLLLILLRTLSVAVLLCLVLQPALQIRNVTRIPNHIVVLLDLSRSMSIREEKNGPSRVERAVALLRSSAARLKEWQKERQVDLFSFGAGVQPLGPLEKGLVPDEPATEIHGVLSEVKRRFRGKDLAGVILISDGIDNGRFGTGPLSPPSVGFLKRLQIPLHTVWVGEPRIRDLALAEVYADDFAFVRNVVRVEADLLIHDLEIDRVPLTLETGGVVVAQREVRIKKDISRYRVQFEFVPPEVGQYVYTLSAPIYAGEALKENNSRSFLLKVIRDRIRVLQLCGRPSWDERFLRQLLKRDPNVDLISFFILRTPADLGLVPPTELSLIPFPTEELFEKELGSFDLVILQNFNYKPYGIGVYLPHLRRFVEGGGGLAMIGGDLSFSSGEYAESPLAEVLPVKLLAETSDPSRLLSLDEFRIQPTAKGADHPILQIGRTRWETQQLLHTLPLFAGANLVAGTMPGTTVLAEHPSLKDAQGASMPVLAVREVGKGRTLALMSDSSWFWAFPSVGMGGTRQAYDRFWRNAIRWLIHDPELKYLRIIPQQDSLPLGSPIKAIIRAYEPDYSLAKGTEVHYELAPLLGGQGLAKVASTNADGEISVEHKPSAMGTYVVRASATLGGRPTTEEALVLVEPAGKEEEEPRATPSLLKQLSENSEGRFLERPASLPDLSFREPRVLHVNWRKDVELWNHWWSLLACLFFLGLEWSFRRRYGYL
jgi:uncharacterized membrane protein